MDLASLAAANRALGNDPFAAALEITLTGPELEALQDLRLALGTDVRPIKRGDRLASGQVRRGVRAYLAAEGGLALPLPGEPIHALTAGEVLHGASGSRRQGAEPPRLPIRWGEPLIEVRAHRGPQWHFFASPEVEKADRANLYAALQELENLKGKVARSAENLQRALQLNDDVKARFERHRHRLLRLAQREDENQDACGFLATQRNPT